MPNDSKAKPSRPMEGFPEDGNPWRIDLIGGVSYSVDDEPRLRFFLSRIKKNTHHQKALLNGSLFQSESGDYQYTYHDAKIGFIQLIKTGSVWTNGYCQLEYRGVTEQFRLELRDTELVSLAKTGAVPGGHNQWEQLLCNYQYRINDENARAGMWVVVVRNNVKYDKIIIPSSVIFQRCYVTSPKAASKIIYGQIDKLIDVDESGFVDGEPGVFRVVIFRDYKTSEAPMLVNLLTDPAGISNLKQLRRNLVVSQSNHNKLTNLRVNFPFSNPMDIEVVGRVINYKDSKTGEESKGFFVSEIKSLRTDFQFNTFVPIRKNRNEKSENQPEELVSAYGGINTANSDDDEIQELVMTNNDVSAYLDPVQAFEEAGVFPNKMREVKEEKEIQKYKNKGFTSTVTGVSGGGVSTGPSRNIKSGEHELEVVLAPPAKLDDFFDLLKQIKDINPKINFETIPICNSIQSDRGIVNYFNKSIKGLRSWHFTESRSHTRGFVVACCEYAGACHYLIDVEAKGTSALSIAYIVQNSGAQITSNDFSLLMTRFAKEYGWSVLKSWNSTSIWRVELHGHVRNKSQLRSLAVRIIGKMR